MIALPLGDIELRVQAWRTAIGRGEMVAAESVVGGGSLPGEALASFALALQGTEECSVNELAKRLRLATPPVIGRVEHDRLLLDPRTVDPIEDAELVRVLKDSLV